MKAAVRLHVYLLLAVTFFACAKPSLAQEQPNVSNFIDPASAYHTNDFDSVDVFNQRLGITVPLHADHSQRGNLNFTYSLQYAATTQWYTAVYYDAYGNPYYYWQPATGTINSPHFSMDGDLLIGANTYGECGNPNTGGWCVANYAGDESGAMHYLGTTSESPYAGETVDGSGIRFDGSALINRQGVRFQQINPSNAGSPVSIEDANGNLLTFTCDDAYADCTAYSYDRYMTDTLGRVWAYRVHSSDVSTCPGGTVNADILDIPGFNGSTSVYKLCYNWVTVSTSFGLSCCAEFSGPQLLATSLILPDGSTWQFQYDLYGDLTNVTLPTGGTVTYNWTTNASYERILTSRIRWDGTNTTEWDYNGTTVTADATGAHNDTVYTAVNPTYPYCDNRISQVQTYQGPAAGGNLLQTLSYSYQVLDNPFLSDMGSCGVSALQTTTITTMQANQESQTTQAFDSGFSFTDQNWGTGHTSVYGLVISVQQNDWGNGAVGPMLSYQANYYQALEPGNSAYLTANLLSLPFAQYLYDGSWNECTGTSWGYDYSWLPPVSSGVSTQHWSAPTPGVYGDVNELGRWVSDAGCHGGGWAHVYYQDFYDTGMLQWTQDAIGNRTNYSYDLGLMGAYPTQVCNALTQCTNNSFDWNTGLLISTADPNDQANGVATTYTYDTMFRPTQVKNPDGGESDFNYLSATVIEELDKIDSTPLWKDTVNFYDALGRIHNIHLDSDPQGQRYTDFTYDALGRLYSASNPHYASSGATDGTTYYTYDALNRPTSVVKQDGSAYNYSGYGSFPGSDCHIETDEAGKVRTLCYDALGRLEGVGEDTMPGGLNAWTNYTYDGMGNLTSVSQSGSRTRTFTYDGLSRVLSATNPESGTTAYTYDPNGNVATRTRPAQNQTDPASTITTNYYYDALNRLSSTSYTDNWNAASDPNTPTTCNFYDGSPWWPLANIIGRRWASAMCTSGWYAVNSAQTFSYDVMGQVWENDQCATAACNSQSTYWKPSYTYNFLGDVHYESTVMGTLTYLYDAAARPTSVTNTWVDSQHPATLAQVAPGVGYFPAGPLRVMTLGNGLTENDVWTGRLQHCRSNWNSSGGYGTFCADANPTGTVQTFYGNFGTWGSTDNGNLTTWSGSGAQNFSRAYTYDSLNRLASLSDSVGTVCPGLSWSYDAWGNRTAQTVTGGSCGSWSAGYSGANQITNPGFQYDAAGNLTYDGTHTYFYDAENRLIQVDGTLGTWPNNCSSATACYIYDADGRRVEKQAGGVTTDYVYDLSGNVINEFQNGTFSTGYVYFNGQLLAQYSNGTTYFAHNDHLGSTRLLTTYSTTPSQNQQIADSFDFLPFGEQIAGGSGTTHKFTGKERDSESGLDNFGARYNSSQMGRFMSPDPSNLSVDFWLPQTWNRYSYALNNPLSMVDRNGLWPWYIHDSIIEQAFPGMSKQDLKALEDASAHMDNDPGQQSAALSFEHGMSNGLTGQTPSEAEMQADAFIAQNEHDAAKIQADWIASGHSGIAPAALTAFGNALHTITDRLSPAHAGYQPWYGQSKWNPSAWWHFARESFITSSQMNTATSAAQQAFQQTFGLGWDEFDLQQLQLQQPPQACVTVTDSLTGTTSTSCQ